MSRPRGIAFLALFALVVSGTCLARAWGVPDTGGRDAGGRAPILVLVSFDGWRFDYIDRGDTPRLSALARRGVRAKALIPSFPVLTFPNHYTIVTGLYPAHHGIVANNIVESGYPERFTMASRTARDARWWSGEPVWVTAAHQGLRS